MRFQGGSTGRQKTEVLSFPLLGKNSGRKSQIARDALGVDYELFSSQTTAQADALLEEVCHEPQRVQSACDGNALQRE